MAIVLHPISADFVPRAAESIKRTELGEVLLNKGPLPVNTIAPKVWLTPGSISVGEMIVRPTAQS